MRRLYDQMLDEVPPARRWHTPFFRRIGHACAVCLGDLLDPTGHTCQLCTSDVADMVAAASGAAGLVLDLNDEDACDAPQTLAHRRAHVLRIGGASDVHDAYGTEEGRRILVARGRWGSDIAFIYPRVSTQQQFAASLRMTGVSDVALETAVPSWTQGRG